MIWQYYRGQGIQLQMLANFGRANALWSSKKRTDLRALLDELIPLASDRGGFLAWEYFFTFDGGAPPWASSITQGTAVQAIGRAGKLLNDPALTDAATRALGLFEQPPPVGVRDTTPDGAFYVIYSFAPDLLVLNAHLQAVIGLYDFAQLTGDPRAQALYTAGESEARVAVPRYDTGKWSLYSLQRESDLSYHELVDGLPHEPLQAHPGAGLLRHGHALHRLPEGVAGGCPEHAPHPRREARADRLLARQDLTRRSDREGLAAGARCSPRAPSSTAASATTRGARRRNRGSTRSR